MTPKPKGPHGGDGTSGKPHGGGDGGDGRPSQKRGDIDASSDVSGAQSKIEDAAKQGRGSGKGDEPVTPATSSGTQAKPDYENPAFDDRKLTEYALNPAHPVGGNKAKVIESKTGLGKDDAAAVKQQILDQVKGGGDGIPGKVDEHGSRFAKDVTLTGPNGTIVVRTAWIVDARTGETRLATVSFPPKTK
jgi:hypothetical protein